MIANKDLNEDLVAKLLDACQNSDMDKVKYYLNYPVIEKRPHINDSREVYKFTSYTPLMSAVQQNNMELVKYLLLSPDLKEHADINCVCINSSSDNDGYCALSIAAENGLEDMVNFLLCSPELHEHVKVFPSVKVVFFNDIKEIEEKEYISYSPLKNALLSENIPIFNMLLSQPELKNNPQLVNDILQDTLSSLFAYKRIEMLSYLLINHIEKTPQLDDYINSITDKDFYDAMIKLMLKIDLESNLEHNPREFNQVKI